MKVWLYIALDRTPNIGYWVGAVPKVYGLIRVAVRALGFRVVGVWLC